MSKAAGIIGIIAGIFGFIAAIVTLFIGGLGSTFEAEGANSIIGFGWGGVLFSLLAIVFGAAAIARPKGAGIGLIIVSILGAILGGTLVAIAMALSFIGGILAVIGAKSAQPDSSAMTTTAETTGRDIKKKTNVWLWAGAGVGVLVIGLVLIGGQTTDKPKEDALTEFVNAQPSALRAEGELSELFALGSKNTNLQRENKLKEIKGKIVQWQLPVYEVSRSGDFYKVQTQSSIRVGPFGQDLVGTFVYITPRDETERKAIEALKTDDLILFKGRISGSSLRSLEIKPAMLVLQSTTDPQVAEASMVSRPTESPTTSPAPVAESAPAPAAVQTAERQVPPQNNRAPSFDCAKASTAIEKAICSDPVLGQLDVVLSENYRHMLASDIGDSARNDLRATQKKWIVERNTCTSNQCIASAYKNRIDEVCEYPVISGAHPICTSSDELK